jgi:hypothetical protein
VWQTGRRERHTELTGYEPGRIGQRTSGSIWCLEGLSLVNTPFVPKIAAESTRSASGNDRTLGLHSPHQGRHFKLSFTTIGPLVLKLFILEVFAAPAPPQLWHLRNPEPKKIGHRNFFDIPRTYQGYPNPQTKLDLDTFEDLDILGLSNCSRATMEVAMKLETFRNVAGTFKGDNWLTWSSKSRLVMQTIPYAWEMVSGTLKSPDYSATTDISQAKWDQLNAECMAMLAGALDDTIFAGLDSNVQSAGDMWKILRETYGTHRVGDRVAFISRLQALKMDGTAADFNQKFLIAVQAVAATGHPVSEIDKVGYYLQGIKEHARTVYFYFSMEQKTATLSDVMSAVLSAELNGDLVQGGMYAGQGQPQCYTCEEYGHLAKQCPNNLRANMQGIRHYCQQKTQSSGPTHHPNPWGGPGVSKGDCLCPAEGPFGMDPTRRGQIKDGSTHLDATSLSSTANSLCDPQDITSLLSVDATHRVFIDSGATDSITPLMGAITGFTPSKIRLNLAAKGAHSVAAGRGTLTVNLSGDRHVMYSIPNVIVDPAATSTLLATKDLQLLGISTIFPADTNMLVLTNRYDEELCRGHSSNGRLYDMPISAVYPRSDIYSAKILSVQDASIQHLALAHIRMGHMNLKDLSTLVKAGKLPDVKVEDLKQPLFCYGCKVGKAHNLPYTQPKRHKVSTPGGRVHLDIWGPVKSVGLRGEKFMLVLIDEGTSVYAVRLMRSKAEAPQHIKDYKAYMEKQHPNFVLRILRSDNAKEILLSKDMLSWMASHGIAHEESPPYTPQQNGKAERAMRTLMEPVRAILAMGQLRLGLWSELVLSVVYIKNRSPSAAISVRMKSSRVDS